MKKKESKALSLFCFDYFRLIYFRVLDICKTDVLRLLDSLLFIY